MTLVFAATGSLLALAGVLVLVRLLRGPSRYDRLVALDTLVVVLVCGVAVWSAYHRSAADIVLLTLIVLVGLLSSLTAARLLPEEERS